jgi:probable HAF family extracellular repeat protein
MGSSSRFLCFYTTLYGQHARFFVDENRRYARLGNARLSRHHGRQGINLFGQVAGTSTVEPCPGGGQYRAFLWTQNDGMMDLGTLPGGTFSLGNAINALGQVVGYSDCLTCDGYHASLWDNAGMQDLGVLPGGAHSAATGLHDFGFVVGESDSAQSRGQVYAFLWTQSDGMRGLGTKMEQRRCCK